VATPDGSIGAGEGAGTGTSPSSQSDSVTARADSRAELRRARRATSTFFLLVGVAFATWAALVPFAKTRLALDEGALGSILLAFGGGTIASTPVAASLIRRHGSRATLLGAGPALCLFVPFLALAPSPIVLAALLFGFGVFAGFLGVAANTQAIAVQAMSGRPLMSSFHALFSVGGLVGASLSSLLLKLGLSVELCAVVIPVALLALVATQYRGLVADREATGGPSARRRVPPPAVVAVGVMTLSLYLAEGAVLDWGAVFLHERRGFSASAAALGYAAFSIAMATGRLLGDRVVERLGPVAVVRFGAALAAAGFLVFVLAPGKASGLVGCALIGLGASNVVPTLISASARVSDFPVGAAVSTVAAMGTVGLIAGPALIGYVADATNLALALAGLAALLMAVGAGAGVVGRGNEQRVMSNE
jgi:predicted MFS family arabinose efflux permease